MNLFDLYDLYRKALEKKHEAMVAAVGDELTFAKSTARIFGGVWYLTLSGKKLK